MAWLALEDLQGIPAGASNLTYLGVEASPYQVAKTLALWGMVKHGCSREGLAQVWYSSIWNLDTAARFRAACPTILDFRKPRWSSASGTDLTAEVKAYLKHWADEKVGVLTLEAARTEWLNTVSAPEGLNNL
eukprot:1847356-Rhodomonas_salina.1